MITDEMVEVAAKRIFRLWRFQPKDRLRVEWVRDGNSEKQDEARLYATAALEAVLPMIRAEVGVGQFALGERVTKIKGSSWTGRVVGFYSTTLTPEGYAVESETERGSVQIYPAAAIRAMKGASHE